jgi:hypothetical protein
MLFIAKPMKPTTSAKAISLDRMVSAMDKVRERLITTCRALDRAQIPYAVVGGNAVALWVSTVDEGAVRNTRDVDVMIRRSDFDQVQEILEREGFTYRHVAGIDVFLDSPDSSVRNGVHIVFAGEMVRQGELSENLSIDDRVSTGAFSVLDLTSLVRIKLTAFRDKDRTHIRDLIEVGLVDVTWLPRLPDALAARLKSILDNPFG